MIEPIILCCVGVAYGVVLVWSYAQDQKKPRNPFDRQAYIEYEQLGRAIRRSDGTLYDLYTKLVREYYRRHINKVTNPHKVATYASELFTQLQSNKDYFIKTNLN